VTRQSSAGTTGPPPVLNASGKAVGLQRFLWNSDDLLLELALLTANFSAAASGQRNFAERGPRICLACCCPPLHGPHRPSPAGGADPSILRSYTEQEAATIGHVAAIDAEHPKLGERLVAQIEDLQDHVAALVRWDGLDISSCPWP